MRYGLTASNKGHFENRDAFPAQSSVLDEEALLHRIVSEYELNSATTCQFVYRGDSDVYSVQTADGVYYLKVYRPPNGAVQVEAEGQLVSDLYDAGAPVVRPIPRHDGHYATAIDAAEGVRPVLVFEEAPHDSFNASGIDSCHALGEAVARLHVITDSLTKQYRLPVFRTTTVRHDILRYAEKRLSPRDSGILHNLIAKAVETLGALSTDPPHFGLCHGDLALSNIRLDSSGRIVFFDFGAASYTWRGYEVATTRSMLPGEKLRIAPSEHRDAFLVGYASIRNLPSGIPDCMGAFVLYRRLQWVCAVIATCTLRTGTEVITEKFVADELSALRDLAARTDFG